MISTKLHWIQTPARGKLAISARPAAAIGSRMSCPLGKRWVSTLSSRLLEPSEERELELTSEADVASLYQLDFLSFPIPDRGVPPRGSNPSALIEHLKRQLQADASIVIHCRQGVGRSGMIASSVLTALGLDPAAAIEAVAKARGIPVPETQEQHDWISEKPC